MNVCDIVWMFLYWYMYKCYFNLFKYMYRIFFWCFMSSQCKVPDTKSCNDLMCHETQGHNVEVTIIIHVQCIINTIWNVMIYWNHKKFHLLRACQIVVCVSFAVYIFNCLVLGSMIKYYIKNQLKPCGYLHKCKKITYA